MNLSDINLESKPFYNVILGKQGFINFQEALMRECNISEDFITKEVDRLDKELKGKLYYIEVPIK